MFNLYVYYGFFGLSIAKHPHTCGFVMMLFLSHAGLSEVMGGVETYAQFMKRIFKDLELLDYHSLKEELQDSLLPVFREPERARKLGEYVNKNYADAETIFTNGMFGE